MSIRVFAREQEIIARSIERAAPSDHGVSSMFYERAIQLPSASDRKEFGTRKTRFGREEIDPSTGKEAFGSQREKKWKRAIPDKKRSYVEVPKASIDSPKNNEKGPLVQSAFRPVEVAKQILASGSFTSMPEDLHKTRDNWLTIGEVQGSQPLRRVALHYSLDCPEAFSTQALRNARSVSQRNFRFFQMKRLGHALNLEAKVSLTDGTSFNLRGFNEAFSIPMISASIKEYSQGSDSLMSIPEGEWVSQILGNSISHDTYNRDSVLTLLKMIRDPNEKNLVTISSGYDWHVTHLFFYRGYLIFCNRGAGSGEFPGIRIFKVGNRDNVTEELLTGLIRRQDIDRVDWKKKYNIDALIQNLELEPVFYLKQRTQLVGNCTYISTKSAVRSLIAIGHLMGRLGDAEVNITSELWKEAFILTKAKYKGWSSFDKKMVIKDFAIDKEIQCANEILKEGEIQKIWNLVEAKVRAKPEKYQEILLRYFAAKRTGLDQPD